MIISSSVMKLIPQLHRDHPRFSEMRASKRIAEVDKVPFVRNIGCRQFCRPVFTERLPYRQIEQTIAGQMIGAVCVQETRSVAEISGDPASIGHDRVEA